MQSCTTAGRRWPSSPTADDFTALRGRERWDTQPTAALASRTVIAGLDGSPASLAAAERAAREARRRRLPLKLLHAMEE